MSRCPLLSTDPRRCARSFRAAPSVSRGGCRKKVRMAERRSAQKRRRSVTEEVPTLWPPGKSSADVDRGLPPRRRLPFGPPKKTDRTNVYVTKKTQFKAQLLRCERLLDAGASEVIIHGLGSAINRACNLALQLKEVHRGAVDLEVKTSTANLIDDLEPVTDDAEYETRSRNNSSVHIRVFRKAAMSAIKYAQ